MVEKSADVFSAILARDALRKVPQAESLEENEHRSGNQGKSEGHKDAVHFAHINNVLIELVEEESETNKRQRTD